jgi:hypothetical protein
VIDKVNPSETKRYQDEVSRLKKDLSSEREKCKRLEADLSILIKGRSCEVNELNDIIARGAGISIIGGADIHIFVFTDCKNNRFQ